MTYIGTVKEGKIELPESVKLPEGASVRVEVEPQENWRADWEDFAKRVGEKWKGPQSAVETVSEMRR